MAHLGVSGVKLDEADALELSRLAVSRQPHIDDGAGLAECRHELRAHFVLACGQVQEMSEHAQRMSSRADGLSTAGCRK